MVGDTKEDCLMQQIKQIKEDAQNEDAAKTIDANKEKSDTNPLKRTADISNGLNPSTLIDESQVGITEFLNSNNAGFDGAIKKRYSDFNVYEVGLDDVIVHVTDQTLPVEVQEVRTYSELSESEKQLVSEIKFSKLKLIDSDRKSVDSVEFDVTEFEKDKRRELHMILKGFHMIDANTLDKDGKKLVVAKRKKNQQGWPRDRPRFLHFSLYKENMETFEACSQLANKVRTQVKFFSFAGTKDKRGRTVQRISVSMVEAKSIFGAARCIRNLEVGNFSYKDKEIKLGDHKGNHFELVIRNVTKGADVTDPILRYFQENGFINYFGMQRFGTMAISTHEIGQALLKSDWKTAIELILKPREGEGMEVVRRARKVWWETRNPRKALEILRSGRKDWMLEAKLLQGLVKMNEQDQVGALNFIPRSSRQLYVHAYQSYVWNKVVSRRIKEYGTLVMLGDLVKVGDGEMKEEGMEDSEEAKVKVVTEVEGLSIFDVLLPLPGNKVRYPDNFQKGWYEEILKEDGLTFDSFANTVKDYNVPGDYRQIVTKAWNVSWYNTTFNDANDNITKSDKDRLEDGRWMEGGNEEKEDEEERNERNAKMEDKEERNGSTGIDEKKEGKFAALVVSFSLIPGSYATMALREVMRVATDKASMTKMNDLGAATDAGVEKQDNDEIPTKKQKLEEES